MTEIPRQKFLSGLVVGPTTQLSVFCTVAGLVVVTHSYCEHLFCLFNWQTWQSESRITILRNRRNATALT